MSFTNGGSTSVFPLKFIQSSIKTYIKDHGKAPKLLVVNSDDLIDYKLNLSIYQMGKLFMLAPELKITHGDYLQKGEIDLAMGIKPEVNDKNLLIEAIERIKKRKR